jgi:hypothetical protein
MSGQLELRKRHRGGLVSTLGVQKAQDSTALPACGLYCLEMPPDALADAHISTLMRVDAVIALNDFEWSQPASTLI